MHCSYCGSNITQYPDDRVCPNCGGLLPPRPIQPQQPPTIIYPVQQPVYRVPLRPGYNCCARCMGQRITVRRRGFSWGWGIFWFFLIPVFGIFLGFCGANKQIYTCQSCGHTWKTG